MATEFKILPPEELEALREQMKKEAAQMQQESARKEAGASGDGDLAESGDDTEAESEEASTLKHITVEVAEDRMSAAVTLSAPGEGEKYTVPEVVAALRSVRVVLGFQPQDILELISAENYDEPCVVAKGKEVQPGVDGYFEFLVDLSEHNTPEIREDGTCDYSAMGRLANIREGDIIAKYHPAVQGVKGYDVMGAELLPKYAKDQTPLRGRDIEYDSETLEYRALVSGKISCTNNNVQILTVHEINDDIDMTIGKVEFFGDVVINGNVESGVVVRAGRNVTINGVVSGANIYAGGDIVLSKGVQGDNKSKISARGSVYANFIEYTEVEAQGDVFANSIVSSKINCNGKVIVEGTRGIILGGLTHGLKGVTLRTSGSGAEPLTEIHAGFRAEDYTRYMELANRVKELKSEAQETVETMSGLLMLGKKQGIHDSQKQEIFKLKSKKDEIYAQIEEIERDKKEISSKMAMGANASISIRGDIHINTIIEIDASILKITKDECFTKFVCRNSVIERKVITA